MLECCKEKTEVNGKAKRENKELRNQRPFFEDYNALPRSDSGVDDGNRAPVITGNTKYQLEVTSEEMVITCQNLSPTKSPAPLTVQTVFMLPLWRRVISYCWQSPLLDSYHSCHPVPP